MLTNTGKLVTVDSLYGIVIQTDPFMVQYFEPTSRGDAYKLNDIKFEVFSEDFVKKVEDPKVFAVGRSRVNFLKHFCGT